MIRTPQDPFAEPFKEARERERVENLTTEIRSMNDPLRRVEALLREVEQKGAVSQVDPRLISILVSDTEAVTEELLRARNARVEVAQDARSRIKVTLDEVLGAPQFKPRVEQDEERLSVSWEHLPEGYELFVVFGKSGTSHRSQRRLGRKADGMEVLTSSYLGVDPREIDLAEFHTVRVESSSQEQTT